MQDIDLIDRKLGNVPCESRLALCLVQKLELPNPFLDPHAAGGMNIRVKVMPRSTAVIHLTILLQEQPAHDRKCCRNVGVVHVSR